MYIEVEGTTYYIIVTNTQEHISVIGHKADAIQLLVPSSLPQSELLLYLTANKSSLAKKAKHTNAEIQLLSVFDKNLPISLRESASKAYLDQNSVIVSKFPVTATAIDRLKMILLEQVITKHISYWEEKLGFLVESIFFRKLKVNYFLVSTPKKQLTFNKRLVDKPLDVVEYIAISAFLELAQIPGEHRPLYLRERIPHYKQIARVINFEQQAIADD